MEKCFGGIQNVKKLKFEGDWGLGRVKTENLFSQTILGKIFWTKKRNSVKLDRLRKVWYLFLRGFELLLPKFIFWKGDWALGYESTQIWDFRNISLFSKILILKSFGNLWGNSYTKFAVLDTSFRFTCG